MSVVTLIKNIGGMNNRIDPSRLPQSADFSLAAEIVNMRVRESGECERDYGNSIVLSGNYHSMFCDGGPCYSGYGQTIRRFMPDEATVEVVTGLSGSRFAYVRRGGLTFYSDTVANKGVLNGSNVYEWADQSYLETTNRTFSGAPIPRHMAILNGRMYMVPADQPDTVLWSERGQVGVYNRSDSFRRFESNVIMLASVRSGLFVSTEDRIVFIRVSSPHQLSLEPLAAYPAVEWSMAHSKSSCRSLGLEVSGECRVWRSTNGVCIGTDSGEFFNVTEGNILLPDTCNASGASVVIGNYIYSSAQ